MLDHEDPSVASKFTLRRARGGRTRSVPSSVHGAPLVRPPPPPLLPSVAELACCTASSLGC
jgi:hypothetical protein